MAEKQHLVSLYIFVTLHKTQHTLVLKNYLLKDLAPQCRNLPMPTADILMSLRT